MTGWLGESRRSATPFGSRIVPVGAGLGNPMGVLAFSPTGAALSDEPLC